MSNPDFVQPESHRVTAELRSDRANGVINANVVYTVAGQEVAREFLGSLSIGIADRNRTIYEAWSEACFKITQTIGADIVARINAEAGKEVMKVLGWSSGKPSSAN